ncbi:isochorismatase family protein [Nakamurella flava]|uniref:nicotinamidase n=1 Tax=Nakamurella flava TaxID=2576308 RepID=A0A4U6QL71_9ACTN|nr:isochorismatase family protein [Nakamurella flava]TKV61297.1 isochorismatase family protein [Nakamurella flava]
MTTSFGPEHALIIVDLQHDFADPGGALYVRGGEHLLDPINALIEEATTAGAALIYTQDWHPPVTPHFAAHGGLWPVHCVIDTPGADLLPGLRTTGPVLRKGSGPEDGYSGFSVLHLPTNETRETELDDFLQAHGARALTVVGLAGDWCVKETAIDGARLGYDVTVPLEYTRFVELRPGDTDAAVEAMKAAGVEVTGEVVRPG